METLLDKTIFSVIDPPNLRINLPRWFTFPSPMQTFFFILLTYFLVSGGIVYDIINEPPSIGSTVDERGNSRPVAIMPYRVNGQYIMEGLVASLMFCLGGWLPFAFPWLLFLSVSFGTEMEKLGQHFFGIFRHLKPLQI
ncbi:hypothetical protein niasHS_014146 [Heterodera schachtii]|uniref:Oligosaccharyltransferase complex subunit n=1 Tax=Heterodera schachtii TaxID=97005 RepID=A0ABD2IIA0_HETSC